MDDEFRTFLKKGGRSASATDRILAYVQEFEQFLVDHRNRELGTADADDLEAFVAHIEQEPGSSANVQLWGLGYYFAFTANEDLRQLAAMMREARKDRRPFPLRGFRGLNPQVVEQLAAAGIKHVQHILMAGSTAQGRAAIAATAGVSEDVVLEIVKLADLARIPGVKGIRARLYTDAGVDTLEKLAQWEPEPLHEMLVDFVAQTGFDGIAPLPAEVRFTIAQAQSLPIIVEY